jgi:hypothetical protein
MEKCQMTTGRIVEVRTPVMGGGTPLLELWDAAIPEKQTAEAAVRQAAGASADTPVVAAEVLSENTLNGLGLKPGEVRRR